MNSFLADERGATAIEYGLVAALITLVIISGITALGGGADGMWSNNSDRINAAFQSSP
ncbi:MAG: Flp family type IVb pilin [Oceanicaulis sp.]